MFYQAKFVKSLQVISFRDKQVRWVTFTRYRGNWSMSLDGPITKDKAYCQGSWLFRLYPLFDAVDKYDKQCFN